LEEFAANPIANGTLFNTQPGAGVCVGREFSRENLFEGNKPEECRGILPGYREIAPGEKCSDTYAGSQVSTCSGYDCVTLVNNIHTDRLADRLTDRHLLTGYTISSAC